MQQEPKKPIMFFLALLFLVMLTIQSGVDYYRGEVSGFEIFVSFFLRNFVSLGIAFLIGIPVASIVAYKNTNK